MSAVQQVLTANDRFAASFPGGGESPVPRRGLAVVTCMDARIDVLPALGLTPGEAHVIRNAGAVVTDDVIRSLVVSQHKLQTTEILVMAHTECGMRGLDEQALAREIAARTGEPPALAFGAFADLEDEVRRSVARLRETPLLLHRDGIRGSVYDVRTGRVREVA